MSYDYISHGVPTVPTPVAPAFLVDISAGVLYTNPTNAGAWVAVGSGVPLSFVGIADAIPPTQESIIVNSTAADIMTLAAPTTATVIGSRITVTSNSNFAHSITTPGTTGSTAHIQNGATGGPFKTATFPAFAGASITLEVVNGGFYNVLSSNGVITYS